MKNTNLIPGATTLRTDFLPCRIPWLVSFLHTVPFARHATDTDTSHPEAVCAVAY